MTSPCRQAETLVLSERMRHANHPVLSWMAANCALQTDHQGNCKLSKAKSTERIDGMVAMVMALGIHAVATATPPDQSWDIITL